MNKKVIQNTNISDSTSVAPLIVIVGPTASGKSVTAMRIAEEWGGEIICADSRTIYKGMDIGTAKPSAEEQARVPHWGLDLVEPGDVFTAADFQKYARQKIQEIRERGKVPMVVGGTGLYVDGLIFNYEFAPPQPELRVALETMTLDELKEYCKNNNVELPENPENRRYVMRAIERKNVSGKRLNVPIDDCIIVGITTEREELKRRIAHRSEQLFENGMVEEAKMLGEKYGWDSEAMTGNIYRLVKRFLDGEFDEAELKERFITSDWQLAKRQITWLKRNPYIHWAELNDAYTYIHEQLSMPPSDVSN
ncbi:MAG: tRNA (adenosine(37)-N6)-dimethylallyltransferase MiaA [Candidatus Microsaccharimonas sp.]